MKITTVDSPVTPLSWPVGTIARVKLKGKSNAKHPNGYLRMHVLIGVPAGANVDADNPATLASVRSAAVNLVTGSVKGYGIDQYDVLEVFNSMTVAK